MLTEYVPVPVADHTDMPPPRLAPSATLVAATVMFPAPSKLITPTSPKRHDLIRDGRFALQSFPQPKPGSDEFYVTGKAELVDDPEVRAEILRAAKHMADASEVAFELRIDRVMHTRWEHVLTPQMRSVHRKWRR